MALAPGASVGPYEVTALLGEGGMGKVWRAHHTALKRDDALKVLPDAFATDPERLARFQREAQVLASLNHPNIAHVYGLEDVDGVKALVMELVEGPTLDDRIKQGPIPVDEALPIAKQVAEALEAAHEQGVIHRDLKPANVKVRPDGTVKVLDFGLAKALEPAGAAANISESPTLTTPAMTQRGVILGTAAYMSPEQARGKTVDKRTDVWAFGAVLYEMLTGKRAFAGDDMSDTLANVLKVEPDWNRLPTEVPPRVKQTLRACLQKAPKQRIGDVQSLRLALEGAFEGDAVRAVESAVPPRLSIWRRAVPLALASLVTAVVVGVAVWGLSSFKELGSVARFTVDLPPGLGFRAPIVPVVAISPDGRHFAYNSDEGVYLRTLDELEARLITGTEESLAMPFFSPDGESLGFADPSGQLQRIPVSGGGRTIVAEMNDIPFLPFGIPFGASWSLDDTILAALPAGIVRVSASGGMPELVIAANEGEVVYGPQLLPDGESVLFSVTTSTGPTRWDQADIVVQSLRTGERTVVMRGGSDARYVASGHLVYAVGDALFAVAFDIDQVKVSGPPVSVVQGVARAPGPGQNSAAAHFAVSEGGTLVYVPGSSFGPGGFLAALAPRTLVWVDREGQREQLAAPPRPYVHPRLSPDGTRLALEIRGESGPDIWVWNMTRETLTRLTFDPGLDRFPVWFPDGRRIAFSSNRDGSQGNVFGQAADGTGQAERLAEGDRQVFPTSFSPDAARLVVYGATAGASTGDDNVGVVALETRGSVTPLLESTFGERNAEISPDGRWLAYESDESGELEIYVRPFPDVDSGRWQVSTGGGSQPLWARSGRELFYRSGNAMLAVSVEADSGFVAGSPALLFEGPYAEALGGRNYDVSPDGRRFLMMIEAGSDEAAAPLAQIVIVQNFFEELRQRVPVN